MTPLPVSTERRVQRVRHELRLRRLTVADVGRPTPGFVSVVLTGAELSNFTSLSFDDHVKLMLPGPDGVTIRRDYTPRRFDPSRNELVIEFALHGSGAASDWARQARAGQQIEVGGPRGSMIVPMDYDWHLLAGDATALPAIARRLAELPVGAKALVLVEVPDALDERSLPSAADVQLTWVRDRDGWLAALRRMALPEGEGFVWCAGEARTMAAARHELLQSRGHPVAAARLSAYWKAGESAFHETL